jgi:hypothetical protein
MTYVWLAFAGAIAFFAPNTQELMHRFRPALSAPAERLRAHGLRLRLNWKWATALGFLAAVSLLSLSRPTEFLYFQF